MDQWPDLRAHGEHRGEERPRRTPPRRYHGTFFVQIYARTGEQSL